MTRECDEDGFIRFRLISLRQHYRHHCRLFEALQANQLSTIIAYIHYLFKLNHIRLKWLPSPQDQCSWKLVCSAIRLRRWIIEIDWCRVDCFSLFKVGRLFFANLLVRSRCCCGCVEILSVDSICTHHVTWRGVGLQSKTTAANEAEQEHPSFTFTFIVGWTCPSLLLSCK